MAKQKEVPQTITLTQKGGKTKTLEVAHAERFLIEVSKKGMKGGGAWLLPDGYEFTGTNIVKL